MSRHHQLRSRVVYKRFVAVAATLNAGALVVVGLLPKGTDANDLIPYAAALNLLIFVSGIIMTIVRREVHGARGVAFDLAFALLVPMIFFALLSAGILLVKPDAA